MCERERDVSVREGCERDVCVCCVRACVCVRMHKSV